MCVRSTKVENAYIVNLYKGKTLGKEILQILSYPVSTGVKEKIEEKNYFIQKQIIMQGRW